MTYEPWKNNEYLIRFEHIMDKDDDPQLSLQYNFNISEIFPGNYQFSEMNLAANQRIEDMNRLHFRQEVGQRSEEYIDKVSSKKFVEQRALSDSEMVITLTPMQIRTFIMSPKSLGIISQNVFKLFPLLVLVLIVKRFL